MDCGPAALSALLGGFGVHVSYGRLREACQTDVDGTSIDALEDIANLLGLEAEQVMMPVDHVLLEDAAALPALVITRHPTGLGHFVVAWRRHGKRVQLMDPAVGRRWVRVERFERDLYTHDFAVPTEDFEAWAGSEAFSQPLSSRLCALGIADTAVRTLLERAAEDGWEGLAALDAAARTAALGGVSDPAAAVHRLSSREHRDTIPDRYRFARAGDAGEVAIRGAVLVRVLGVAPEAPAAEQLSPELRAAIEEPRPRPTRLLLGLMRSVGGTLRLALLAVAAAVAGAGTVAEALVVRGLVRAVESGGDPTVAGLLGLATGLLVLEGWLVSAALGLGRGLERHLWSTLLFRLPRLPDPYFRSRPVSDLGERAHRLHFLRQLPVLGVEMARASAEVVVLTAAIVWVSPGRAVPAVLGAVLAVGSALAIQPSLVERDLRLRNHSGATARFYLDGLLGLVALQAHSAERVVEAEHGRLLDEWRSAARAVARTVVTAEAVQGVLGVALAVWLVAGARSEAATDPATFLLLAYWALSLSVLGQRIGVLARQYPSFRNTTMRFLEPMSSPEEPVPATPHAAPASGGADVRFEGVSVVAGGHALLSGVDLHLEPGSRVAVVGPSGAGKSSLVGVLLGWHRAAEGRVLVDGWALDGPVLDRLRRHTAWVDPQVTVWNRTLDENLSYGAAVPPANLTQAVEDTELRSVIDRLPLGMGEQLGEGGGLLSGGEAQRVRLARARLRTDVRLAVLDEPFRGLDRPQRRRLLERAQGWWPGATVLFVTHDVSDTLGFGRVLVVDGGRVVEDGPPRTLAEREGSQYRALLAAENEAAADFADPRWRRLWLEGGHIRTAERP